MSAIKFDQVIWIGVNNAYEFGVGLAGGRWVGFAAAESTLFVFSEISERHELGLVDVRQAILRTGAIAQDPEQAYGGVDYWLLGNDLRGDPADFRCDFCGAVCCDGACREVYEPAEVGGP